MLSLYFPVGAKAECWISRVNPITGKAVRVIRQPDGRYRIITYFGNLVVGVDVQDHFPAAAELRSWGVLRLQPVETAKIDNRA